MQTLRNLRDYNLALTSVSRASAVEGLRHTRHNGAGERVAPGTLLSVEYQRCPPRASLYSHKGTIEGDGFSPAVAAGGKAKNNGFVPAVAFAVTFNRSVVPFACAPP